MIQPSISDQAASSKQILKELIRIFGHKIETLVADACFCIFLAEVCLVFCKDILGEVPRNL